MKRHLVHIVRCQDYEQAYVKAAVADSLEALGGLPVKPGDKVLLKPNLLAPRAPDRAVTTHPALVKAAAELVMDCGGKPLIGDSPGGNPGESIWGATGIGGIAEELGIDKIDFGCAGTVEAEARGNVYYLARPALECDLIVNLPKLKTHSLTLFTGAVKNLYGCLPGFQKGNWHRRAPKNEQFSQVVVDIYAQFKPAINIMDGVLAMEGEGPSNGKPRRLGLIIASDNAPALDSVAASIIGFSPDEILTTRYAELRGFFQGRRNVSISGISPEEALVEDFTLPGDRYLRMIPRAVHEILGRFIWTRPEVVDSMCEECGDCAQNCPTNAMIFDGDGPPHIDHKVCINCYCCDEVCPAGAIEKKMSWLAKKLV